MTRVQTKSNGRIVSVIDKDEALTLEGVRAESIDGLELSWHVESRDRLRLHPEDGETDRPTTKVQFDEAAGSYSITIPAALAYGLHAVGGTVEWDVKRGNLYATVISRSEQ